MGQHRRERQRQALRRAGRWRRTALGLYGLAAVIVVAGLVRGLGPADAAAGAPAAGGNAPSFAVRTLDGGEVRSSELGGKVVLVNFWATWCPPCRAEMPGFERVWRDYRDAGFVVLGLSEDRLPGRAVASFAGEHGITYPMALSDAAVASAFGGVNGLPMSVLIDRSGQIRRVVSGIYAESELRADVQRLLHP